jgi:hypothetical protein
VVRILERVGDGIGVGIGDTENGRAFKGGKVNGVVLWKCHGSGRLSPNEKILEGAPDLGDFLASVSFFAPVSSTIGVSASHTHTHTHTPTPIPFLT